jgi:hypothetical protein
VNQTGTQRYLPVYVRAVQSLSLPLSHMQWRVDHQQDTAGAQRHYRMYRSQRERQICQEGSSTAGGYVAWQEVSDTRYAPTGAEPTQDTPHTDAAYIRQPAGQI